MRTKEEIQNIVSQVLTEMREYSGLSQNRMAEKLGIDHRTYARYESGESSPTLAGFVAMCDKIDVPILSIIKKYLYPEQYYGNTEQLRAGLAEYIMYTASDRDIEQYHYIINGPHGSTHAAQMQLFSLIDHLPLDSRLMVAKVAYNAYDIEVARGHLVNSGSAMPDMELLHNALVKATEAVIDGRENYSSGIK